MIIALIHSAMRIKANHLLLWEEIKVLCCQSDRGGRFQRLYYFLHVFVLVFLLRIPLSNVDKACFGAVFRQEAEKSEMSREASGRTSKCSHFRTMFKKKSSRHVNHSRTLETSARWPGARLDARPLIPEVKRSSRGHDMRETLIRVFP